MPGEEEKKRIRTALRLSCIYAYRCVRRRISYERGPRVHNTKRFFFLSVHRTSDIGLSKNPKTSKAQKLSISPKTLCESCARRGNLYENQR